MTDNRHANEKTDPKKRSQNLGQKQAEREKTADKSLGHMGDKKRSESDQHLRKQQNK
jgi:hypothetical protein